jgi:hypothetical protein
VQNVGKIQAKHNTGNSKDEQHKQIKTVAFVCLLKY